MKRIVHSCLERDQILQIALFEIAPLSHRSGTDRVEDVGHQEGRHQPVKVLFAQNYRESVEAVCQQAPVERKDPRSRLKRVVFRDR